jgi:arylsulfatase A-like enzyme
VSPGPLSAGDRLRLAVVFGLGAGLAEVAVRATQWQLRRFTWVSPDVVWVAPLVGVAMMLVFAALLPWISRLAPGARPVRVFVFLAVCSVTIAALLSYEALHPAAACLLAGGLAMQLSAIAANQEIRLLSLARMALPVFVIAGVALAIVVRSAWSFDATGGEATRSSPRAGAPNVLLIVLDTVRAASLSVSGYARPTSRNLETLAQRGAYFERAVATSSWTLPSHASLFTGLYPHQMTADWRTPLDAGPQTLAATLSAKGYATVGIVSNLLYMTRETGIARGFAEYDDYQLTLPMAVKTSLVARQAGRLFGLQAGATSLQERRPANEINDAFLGWLERRAEADRARPFFAFLNYMDTHSPYEPRPPFGERFGVDGPRPDIEARRTWTVREIELEKNAYDATVAFLDSQIGSLVQELERRGSLSNTIVAITSDHGELLGERGLYDHGNSLYWRVLHVPLIVVYPPAVPAGLRVREPVTLRDLPATLLDLADARPVGWPGRSLNSFWVRRARADPRSPVLSEMSRAINMNPWLPASRGDIKSLVDGPLHYIVNGDGKEELYDVERDPEENDDLAAREPAELNRLRLALKAALESGAR